MFRRASRIVITESSASKKAHPAVGDVGYLNNMYLFFVEKFILLDAFFFHYKSDNGKNKKRMERKRFIIDLGMSDKFKRRLNAHSIPKSFFMDNNYVVNLTPTDYRIHDANGAFLGNMIEFPHIYTIWHRHTNRNGNSTRESMPHIPYGQIDVVPCKRSIHDMDFNELRCWMECLLPIIASGIYNTTGPPNEINTISNRLQKIYAPTWVYYTAPIYINGTLMVTMSKRDLENDSSSRRRLVNEIQRSRSVVESITKSCEETILSKWKDTTNILHRTLFSDRTMFRDLIKTCTAVLSVRYEQPKPEPVLAKVIMTFIFRALLMSDNVEKKLFDLRDAGVIGLSTSEIIKITLHTRDMKQSAGHSSAALNRILEEQFGA